MNDNTRYDRIIGWAKNNKLICTIILLVLITTSVISLINESMQVCDRISTSRQKKQKDGIIRNAESRPSYLTLLQSLGGKTNLAHRLVLSIAEECNSELDLMNRIDAWNDAFKLMRATVKALSEMHDEWSLVEKSLNNGDLQSARDQASQILIRTIGANQQCLEELMALAFIEALLLNGDAALDLAKLAMNRAVMTADTPAMKESIRFIEDSSGAIDRLLPPPSDTGTILGYTKILLKRGIPYFISTRFSPTSENNVSEVFGDQLPVGTTLSRWSANLQEYTKSEGLPVAETYTAKGWIPGNTVLGLGETFYVSVPTNAPNPSYALLMGGEVPIMKETVRRLVPGLNFVSPIYPVSMPINSVGLESVVSHGDKVYIYGNTANVAVETATKGPNGIQWNPGTNIILPGVGVVIRTKNGGIWTQTRPY